MCSLALDQPCDVKVWERATVHGTEGTTSNVALCMRQLPYTKVPCSCGGSGQVWVGE